MEDKRVAVELCKAWVSLKKIREQLKMSERSLPALQREITELWTLQMDNIDYLKSLVKSMPRRLEAIIEIDGNATKY